jgi:hypothetical protein
MAPALELIKEHKKTGMQGPLSMIMDTNPPNAVIDSYDVGVFAAHLLASEQTEKHGLIQTLNDMCSVRDLRLLQEANCKQTNATNRCDPYSKLVLTIRTGPHRRRPEHSYFCRRLCNNLQCVSQKHVSRSEALTNPCPHPYQAS